MKKLFLVLIVILFCGCEQRCEDLLYGTDEDPLCNFHKNYEVFIDNNFNESEYLQVIQASLAWTQATHDRIVMSPVANYDHNYILTLQDKPNRIIVIKLVSNIDQNIINDIDNQAGNGIKPKGFSSGSKIYLLTERFSTNMIALAVEHEMGHFIGLSHSLQSTSIMYPYMSGIDECTKQNPYPTRWDIDSVKEVFCK